MPKILLTDYRPNAHGLDVLAEENIAKKYANDAAGGPNFVAEHAKWCKIEAKSLLAA